MNHYIQHLKELNREFLCLIQQGKHEEANVVLEQIMELKYEENQEVSR